MKENSKSKKKFNKKGAKQRDTIRDDLNEIPNDVKYGKDAKLKNHSKYGNPNWYFTDHELAEQASRFSFQSYIGNGYLTNGAQLPSIASLYLNPSLGGYVGSTQDLDPVEDNATVQAVNLMARKLYSRLSAMSGRTSSYAPQDVMFAILGIGEVISLVSHLRRVIGTAFTYNYRNRDFPSSIIKAMGINADDLFQNLAKYRVEFNTILNMANKIPILANVSWFEKCSSIYEGIFQDSPDEMAQMYVFVPATTWILDESSSEFGSILKTREVGVNLQIGAPVVRTFANYLTLLREMINALLTSTTFNIIYSDILNLSSKENVPLMQLDLISENYAVVPQYDEEVLLHIHNLSIFDITKPDYYQNTITDLEGRSVSNCNDAFQDPENNNIIYAPIFKLTGSSNLTDIGVTDDNAVKVIEGADVVDFPYGNPDLTERIEATRFSIRLNQNEIISGETGEDVQTYARTLPDHFCTLMQLWNAGESTSANRLVSTLVFNVPSGILPSITKFRYAPLVYKFKADGSYDYVLGDVNYFTRLDGEWLKRLNSLCLQGLLELR